MKGEIMDSKLIIFENNEFGNVRFVDINGKPYAVANDIANALGYSSPKDTITRHCKGATTYRYLTNGGNQEVKVIPEGDIFRLIVKAADQIKNLDIKEKAERFEVWLFEEVLPSIRKHGTYMTEEVVEKAIADPDFIIKLATELKEEKAKRLEAEKKVEEQEPKVKMCDEFLLADQGIDMDEAANVIKEPNLGRNNLYDWLRSRKILMKGARHNIPYAQYSKYFEVIEVVVNNGKTFSKCLVKPSGLAFIRKRINKEKRLPEQPKI
jgi:anti-repressor protein